MQPIQLTLSHDNQVAQVHHCSAFAMIFPAEGLDAEPTKLAAAVETFFTTPPYRSGRLFLLPRSIRDASACGLVFLTKTREQKVASPPGTIALQPLIDGTDNGAALWIPQDSRVVPSVDTSVLNRHHSHANVRIWLPSIGLVELENNDQLRATDWLQTPCAASESWTSPPQVWTPPQQIVELAMFSPPTAEDFLDDVGEEIGKPKWSLMDSDPTGLNPENCGALSRIKRWVLSKLDNVAGKSTGNSQDASAAPFADAGQLGGTGAGSGSGSGLLGRGLGKGLGMIAGVVSAPMAAMMSRMLQKQRDGQIHKLLQMLQTNPDQALKFAIPIGSIGNAFRGFAFPGAALLARLTDFSLGGLGGGPVDLWNINYQLQAKLQEKYREQANREIAAGRYRRAAYIYAHLLGDFAAAATTLEKGKYFAESAVLYRDKLNNKMDAARCLALSGQTQEASDLYVSLNKYETAGEVWIDAGDETKAKEMFLHAYQQKLVQRAIVSAADILDQRLDRRDDAIDLLRDQWPTGHDKVRCTETAIRWLGQDGRHKESDQFLRHIIDSASEGQLPDVAHIARTTANAYPDHRVRATAEDLCRLSVARTLRGTVPIERSSVLSTLAMLNPNDLQLRRDATGYGRKLHSETKPQPQLIKKSGKLTALSALKLPKLMTCIDYLVHDEQIYALVQRAFKLQLVCASYTQQTANTYQLQMALTTSTDVFTADLDRRQAFLVAHSRQDKRVVAYGPVPARVLLPSESEHPFTMELKPTTDVVAAAFSGQNLYELCVLNDTIFLRQGSLSFDLTRVFDAAEPIEGDSCFDLCVIDKTPIVAIDNHLFKLNEGLSSFQQLHSSTAAIHAIAASMPHTVQRVAVAHSKGLEVAFVASNEVRSVCRDRGYELCLWAPNGRLLAWSDGYLHCFEVRVLTLARIAEVKLSSEAKPAQLLRLKPDTIGVAHTDGTIERFRLPT